MTPSIIMITGIMAAGKSTIAQQLAERLPKSVHLRGDVFRKMIVSGRADIGADFSDEDQKQLRLRYTIAAAAADLYCEAGFTVVYQDIVIGTELAAVVERLQQNYQLHLIVLCPSPETVEEREAGRDKTGYGSWTPAMLDHVLRTETPRLGWWLDTSMLTVDQTVNTILERL